MSTGTIVLNIETPDLNLTGSGEFDVSSYLQELFVKNDAMKDLVSDKLSAIFKQVKTKDISENWSNKIKKAFNIKSVELDIKKETSDHVKKLLKDLKLDHIISTDKLTTKKSNSIIEYNTLDRVFNTLTSKLTTIIKSLDNISTVSNNKADTVFDQVMDVNVTGFSHHALDEIAERFKSSKQIPQQIDIPHQQNRGMLGSVLDSLLKGLLPAGAAAMLGKLSGGALLAGGLLWMAVDGISGWMKSDEWGVSHIAGAIGGALGGTGSGIKNAWKNSLKGGLVGGGIGMLVGGPVGLIIGSLLGAAVGGILGYIGGQNIAKSLDEFGSRFSVWYNTNINKFMQESVSKRLLHLTGNLSLGEDDPTKALRKTFFDSFFILPMGRAFNNMANKFAPKLEGIWAEYALKNTETVLEKHAGVLVERSVAKGSIPIVGRLASIGAKTLKFLGKLPVIGLIFGIGNAYDYIVNKERWDLGMMALLSGLATTIPIAGTGLAIGIDMLIAGNELTQTPEQGKKISKLRQDKVLKILKGIPVLGSFIYLFESFGAFSTLSKSGTKDGFYKLFLALSALLPSLNLAPIMEDELENRRILSPTKSITKIFSEYILSKFKNADPFTKWILNKIGLPVDSPDLLTGEDVHNEITNKATKQKALDDYKNLQKILTDANIKETDIANRMKTIEGKIYERKEFDDDYKKELTAFAKSYAKPTKAQDIVIDFNNRQGKEIQIQPENNDTFFGMEHGGIFAKPDGGIDKQLKSINNVMIDLQKTTEKNLVNLVTVLNNHTEIFIKLLGVETDQLHMLPALASTKGGEQKESFPTTDVRDPIYEYREKVYKNMRA